MLGHPLSELSIRTEGTAIPVRSPASATLKGTKKQDQPDAHTPAGINFVRNRMLYARAAFNAQSGVRFGLRHIRQ